MSTGGSPTHSLQPPSTAGAVHIAPSGCSICNEAMLEGQDCLILIECSHCFHCVCIEPHLSSSQQCPVCQNECQFSDVRALIILAKTTTPSKAKKSQYKPRGTMPKHYNTRRATQNVTKDFQNPQLSFSSCILGSPAQMPDRHNIASDQNVAFQNPGQGMVASTQISNSLPATITDNPTATNTVT